MQKKNEITSKLPNTYIRMLLEKNLESLKFRSEIIWDMYAQNNLVTWDNLITYEIFLKSNLQDEWKKLFQRDYPEIGVYDINTRNILSKNYRAYYLSQPTALEKASVAGQEDLVIIKIFGEYQPVQDQWQFDIDTIATMEIDEYAEIVGDDESFKILDNINPVVAKNKKLMLAAVSNNDLFLKNAPYCIRNDRNIITAALNKNPSSLVWASEELTNDREIAMLAVSLDGMALQHVSDDLKNVPEVVLAAIQENPISIRYASEDLRNNRAIVRDAVSKSGSVFKFASDELRGDRDILLIANDDSSDAYSFASEALMRDPDIIRRVLQTHGLEALEHISYEAKNDHELFSVILEIDGRALQFADPKLQAEISSMSASCYQKK